MTWLSFYYGSFYFVFGIYVPFWAVWMHWLGLSADEIGLVIGAGVVTRCIVNLFVLPRFHHHSQLIPMLRVITIGSTVFAAWHLTAGPDLGWLLLLSVLVNAMLGPSFPVTDTIASHYGRAGLLDYGKVRLWGSAAFILGTTSAGLLADQHGPGAIVPLAVVALVVASCWVMVTPQTLPVTSNQASTPRPKLRQVLLEKRVLLLMVILSLIHGSHATYYAFSAIYWGSAGMSESTVSYLWSIGVGVEIIIFAFSQRLFRDWSIVGLLWLSILAVTIRWLMTAMTTDILWLFAAQSLHGITFGVTHLAAMQFIRQQPTEKVLALQALYSAIPMGAVLAVMTMASGPLYDALSGQAFFVMAGTGVLAAVVLLFSASTLNDMTMKTEKKQ